VTAAAPTTVRTRRVLTGYRPTGPLHVGHWAGVVENMLRLQTDDAFD
jgi:tryptophanyl-tRNA synthetase